MFIQQKLRDTSRGLSDLLAGKKQKRTVECMNFGERVIVLSWSYCYRMYYICSCIAYMLRCTDKIRLENISILLIVFKISCVLKVIELHHSMHIESRILYRMIRSHNVTQQTVKF